MLPTNHEFRLFRLLSGDAADSPLRVALIPRPVSDALGWSARQVYVSVRDAQKIAHHPMHGMDAEKGLRLPTVIRSGDYYRSNRRGTELQLEVVLHEEGSPQRAYFLVLARNREDTGIFIRTFYFNAELSRSRMRHAEHIFIQSRVSYFK